MSTPVNISSNANGPVTVTIAAGPGAVWNLTSLQVSCATPLGTGRVTVYDGSVATGTVLFDAFINPPNLGSGGFIVDVPLPKDPYGRPTIQGSPNTAMNIVYRPAGTPTSIVNIRYTDGLP